MKASLQLRMSQQLTLTPQLQQSIRLLQLSTQDMQQEVARLLDENPMLELNDEVPFNSFSGDAQSTLTPAESSREERQDDDRQVNEQSEHRVAESF